MAGYEDLENAITVKGNFIWGITSIDTKTEKDKLIAGENSSDDSRSLESILNLKDLDFRVR